MAGFPTAAYHCGMSDESATKTHKPSSEFWTTIGTFIAMGTLILTVTGWLRDDIRALSADLHALEADVNSMGVDVKVLDSKIEVLDTNMSALAADVKALDAKVDTIDRRLAVVESHVLGLPSGTQIGEDA